MLTKGKVALVDDEDYDALMQWHWCYASGGAATRGTQKKGIQKTILMHRQIMNPPKKMQIDHINGDRLDNRRSNLRICTQSQNCSFRKAWKLGKSGYRGVIQHNKQWRARIKIHGKKIHLGLFATKEEAAIAYNKAAKVYFGAFAIFNVLPDVFIDELV